MGGTFSLKRLLMFLLIICGPLVFGADPALGAKEGADFPRALDSYDDSELEIGQVIVNRIVAEPFNLAAVLIFFFAIFHTFMTSRFLAWGHKWEIAHRKKVKLGQAPRGSVHMGAGIMHFLGEVEVVFGLWAIVLLTTIALFFGWHTAVDYVANVNFTEPLFVVVIMALASTRPMLKLSEGMMAFVANLFGGTLGAWWLTLLSFGPILGSFITEPAAMTITALLLSKKFYVLQPKLPFKYATLGLLFVNVSVGGTLTHFAAPPVLMVSASWGWDMGFMMTNFGWKAIVGIAIANAVYFFYFREQIARLEMKYDVLRLEYELRNHFMKEDDLQAEFDQIENIVSVGLGFRKAFDKKCDEIKHEIRERIVEKIIDRQVEELTHDQLSELFEKEFNQTFQGFEANDMEAMDLFEWAFETRFEEIKLNQMRKTIPGLLPESSRAVFSDPDWNNREAPVPKWVMAVHMLFMTWTVANAHHPAMFIGGFLFFLGFSQVTLHYQNHIDLKPAMLVGFFLAGLVVHGGVQGWWIGPLLGSFTEVPLMIGATILTAFNDNAAITYLSTLVPNFTDGLKYAVVAGAVTGGGLTVIANAPNPAGLSILRKHFKDGISPAGLFKAALIPTIILGACFMIIR